MNVVVIGGSGLIGTRIIKVLKDQAGVETTNLDIKNSLEYPEITQIGDVRDNRALAMAIENADVVVLAAGIKRHDIKDPSLYYSTHVDGMKCTLSAMEQCGCKRLICFSTVGVYGMNRDIGFDRDNQKDPIIHYRRSMWQAEEAARIWHKTHPDWNISIVRPTAVYGESSQGSVYSLVNMIQKGKFMMVGNGEGMRSLSYVGNVAAFVCHLISLDLKGMNEYTYADEPSVVMKNLVRMIGEICGKKVSGVRVPLWLGLMVGRWSDRIYRLTGKRFAVSESRIRKMNSSTVFDWHVAKATGFDQPYSLEEGLERTIRSMKK